MRSLRTAPASLTVVGLLVVLGLVTGPASARAAGRVECQHPVTTGIEVFDLHRVSARTACSVVLALQRQLAHGHEVVRCVGRDDPRPVLRVRSFQGWRLRVTPLLHLTRGAASFTTGGTDFPASCG